MADDTSNSALTVFGNMELKVAIPGKKVMEEGFSVLLNGHGDYPGVEVIYEHSGSERDSDPGMLIEWPSDENLSIKVWSDGNREDYTHKFEFPEFGRRSDAASGEKKGTRTGYPLKYGLVLKEKPLDRGLTYEEINEIISMLGSDELFPVEFDSATEDSVAMGFITSEYAESLDYDYKGSGLKEFIGALIAKAPEDDPAEGFKYHDGWIKLIR